MRDRIEGWDRRIGSSDRIEASPGTHRHRVHTALDQAHRQAHGQAHRQARRQARGRRRVAVFALAHDARPGRRWTATRLAQLARLRRDPSPEVAGAAARLWPPREADPGW